MGPNAKGALLSLTAFGIYATHDVVIKTLGAIYAPPQIIFFSVILSFPLAIFAIMRDSEPGTLIPVHPRWMAARTVSVVLNALAGFYAFSVLPLAQTYTILFAMPLLITLLAIPMLGEKVRLRRGLAVLAGLIGVLVVLRPGSAHLGLGHLAALGAATCGAFSSVVVRKIGPDERPVTIMIYPMIANFVVMGCALPFVYHPMPIEHIGMAGIIAAFSWTAGLIMIAAYRHGEAVIVAPMQYSQILWATVYGALLFNEGVDRATALGAAIIIASGLYIVLREGRSDASANRPVLEARVRAGTGTSAIVSLWQRMSERRARTHAQD